jgi:flagellar protein FlgJ
VREVARGFEAMLLRQVLSAAGKTSLGGDDLFGSSSDKTFTEMRDARFADLAAASGTLGLAAQIEAQLSGQAGNG